MDTWVQLNHHMKTKLMTINRKINASRRSQHLFTNNGLITSLEKQCTTSYCQISVEKSTVKHRLSWVNKQPTQLTLQQGQQWSWLKDNTNNYKHWPVLSSFNSLKLDVPGIFFQYSSMVQFSCSAQGFRSVWTQGMQHRVQKLWRPHQTKPAH